MARFLKLVRHQNGSWKALPNETETESPSVPLLKKDNAPIDPVQLLKALAPLLSTNGGINGIEKAPQFASLMKKFSKKLVSRCIYCNVLRSTETDILARFLEEGGWTTINNWLNDAKDLTNESFLLELLGLCKVLPMTVERLKENNTPKVVRAFMKVGNTDIKALATELVGRWMVIIKGENELPPAIEPMKKKRKPSRDIEKEQKDPKKVHSAIPKKPVLAVKSKKKELKKIPPKNNVLQKAEKKTVVKTENPKKVVKAPIKTASPKANPKQVPSVKSPLVKSPPVKLKTAVKRPSSEKKLSKIEIYEDVKLKVEAEPVLKKSKIDRPKTVKSYQAKFRATGLDEAIPLPKKIPKKVPTVDKTTAVAVAKNAVVKRLNTAPHERINEKKIKPESLLHIDESANANSGGTKLIPAKPQPVYHESKSFMEALMAAPAPILKKKKKKLPTKPSTPTTPPSPTMKAPRLQFYKDTLEMKEEKESKEKEEEKNAQSDDKISPSSPPHDEMTNTTEPITVKEVESPTPQEDSAAAVEDSSSKNVVSEWEAETPKESFDDEATYDSNGLRSILSLGRRNQKKKSVRWVAEEDLRQILYFEMDETERVNFVRSSSFGDMKSLDSKRERETFETAKRHAGDKMTETLSWWTVPIYIEVPPQLVVHGCYSQEKEIQYMRQQSILQELYFGRETIPDSAQEPEAETCTPNEPKIIPLDEENTVGSLLDYSAQEIPKPKALLPEALSSLLKIPSSRNLTQSILGQLPLDPSKMQPPPRVTSPPSPYDPGEPVVSPLHPPLLAGPPPMFNNQPLLEPENMGPQNWGMPPMDGNMGPPDQFFPPNFPINTNNMMMDNMPMMQMNNVNDVHMRMPGPMYRPNMRGPRPMNRQGGGPQRHNRRIVPCRHFVNTGNCRFGSSCSFLHPGINGPPL